MKYLTQSKFTWSKSTCWKWSFGLRRNLEKSIQYLLLSKSKSEYFSLICNSCFNADAPCAATCFIESVKPVGKLIIVGIAIADMFARLNVLRIIAAGGVPTLLPNAVRIPESTATFALAAQQQHLVDGEGATGLFVSKNFNFSSLLIF